MPLLFPTNGEPITIRQGSAGDCYLLTAIDCILNSGSEGLALVKSMFTETAEGVSLRIKRTDIFDGSNNLTPEKLKGKYIYHYDAATNEDVFFLSNQRLQEIDESEAGVRSNSLAIKILERISSYYYTGYWPNEDINASVNAHNITSRYNGSSTVFAGKFIGVDAQDSDDIYAIIKLKLENPEQPVYISMSYGHADHLGRVHGRHALRIDKVVRRGSGPNDYDFILINPWNNQKTELFSCEEIKHRNYRFSIFKINAQAPQNILVKPVHDLDSALKALSPELCQFVHQNPRLLNLLSELKYPFLYTQENVQAVISFYKSTPYFVTLFNSLSANEKVLFNKCLIQSKGSKQDFIEALLRAIPMYFLIRLVYEQEAELDFKRIGAVVLELSSGDENQSLKMRLNSIEFFGLMMRVTHQEKMRDASLSAEEATRFIDWGLVNYHFSKGELFLSRSGHQRFFFTNGVIDPESISYYWDYKTLYAKAVATLFYIRNNAEELQEAVKVMDINLVDETFLGTLLATIEYKDSKDLLTKADNLSTLNPELAKKLHALIVARFKLIETPKEEAQENMLEQLNLKSAMEIIDSYADLIAKLPVSFKNLGNSVDIQQRSQTLRKQLDDITSGKADFDDAVNTLCEPGQTPDKIKRALEDKIGEIEAAVAAQHQKCLAAFRIIETYLKKIREKVISFSAVTIPEISAQSDKLLAELNELANNKELYNARMLVSDLSIPEAITDKQREISNASGHQVLESLLARAIVTSYVRKINEHQVSFDEVIDSEIDAEALSLLAEVNELVKNQDLINARKLLSDKEIDQAIDAHKKSIEQAANARKQMVKAAHSIITSCMAEIGRLTVSFADCETLSDVTKKQWLLFGELKALENRPDLIQAELTLGKSLQKVFAEKRQNILQAGEKVVSQIRSAEAFLLKIDFTGQMNKIVSMQARLHQNGQKNVKYELAGEKVRELYDALLEAKRLFMTSDLPEKQRLVNFRDKSLNAIDAALPTLVEHRGWKEFLADFANVIIAVCTLFIANAIAGRFRLFQPQTASALVAEEVADTFRAIDVGA